MGEVLSFEREAAAHEAELSAKEAERNIVELRNAIGRDKISLLAREQELKKFHEQREVAESELKSSPDIAKALEAMKKIDAINDQIGAKTAERGKLIWDLRARHSDLGTLQDMYKELSPSPEAASKLEKLVPPFTKVEEAWFKKGDAITAKMEALIGEHIEDMPFTPEEEKWFEKGEERAA